MLWGSALIFVYVLSRAVLPLGCGFRRKLLLGFGVFLLSFKFQLMRRIAGPMFFAPDLPNGVLVATTWCYAVFFLFFLLLAAADLVRFAWWCVCKIGRLPSRNTLYAVNMALLVAAAMLASLGMVNCLKAPELRTVEARYAKLPPELEGFKIALLADLHADKLTPPDSIPDIVRRVNALEPGLIAIAGDFADGPVGRIAPKLAPLKDLRAKHGVFAVPGNHEYYSGYAEYISYLATLGMTVLENSRRTVTPQLVVAGITDPAARRYGLPMPDVHGVLDPKKLPAGAFVLFLAHEPVYAKQAWGRADMQLSGHTHGGLMRGFDKLVALFNGGFVSDLYKIGDMLLYVSRGTSLWKGFPVRLGVPAEITLITLKRAG